MKILVFAALLAGLAHGQGALADYQRGQQLQAKANGLVVNSPGAANWIGDSDPRERRLEPLLDCGFVVDCAGALYRRGEVSWQNTILSRRTNG